MKTMKQCPQCHTELAPGNLDGLCPHCLLKCGMASATRIQTAAVEPAATQTLNPALGTNIRYFGDYELLEEIARGGMGVIYKARQKSLNRVVALKMILSGQLATEAEVKRFHVEAEAAASLQHPNIVAIHEIGVYEGRHYFTMDYVDGTDLARLAKGQSLPAERAARYVKTIADAVHFAHQRGTLHRDLKPQNILIDKTDLVRITDFGLARQMYRDSGLTRTGVVMGSPSYMSPEQAQGQHDVVGPQSDVYSIGAILYELLTGRPPFSGESAMQTLVRVIEDSPVAPRKINVNIPIDLETICLKCLEKAPGKRYASARALAEDLERFLQGEPIQARPVSAFLKTAAWFRRHPSTLAGMAALAILLLAYGMFYLAEENSFLRALQANPALKRMPGPLHQALALWSVLSISLTLLGQFINWGLFTRVALLWKVPTARLSRPWARTVAGVTGMTLFAFNGWFVAKTIQAFVWERSVGFDTLRNSLFAYGGVFMGMEIVIRAWKEYRRAERGRGAPDLDPAVVASIRHAILNKDLASAIQVYHGAVPGADATEACLNVARLGAAMGKRDLQTVLAARRSATLAALNIRLMAITAFVEIAVAILLVAVFGVACPSPIAGEFMTSFSQCLLAVLTGFAASIGGRWLYRIVLVSVNLFFIPPLIMIVMVTVPIVGKLEFISMDMLVRTMNILMRLSLPMLVGWGCTLPFRFRAPKPWILLFCTPVIMVLVMVWFQHVDAKGDWLGGSNLLATAAGLGAVLLISAAGLWKKRMSRQGT